MRLAVDHLKALGLSDSSLQPVGDKSFLSSASIGYSSFTWRQAHVLPWRRLAQRPTKRAPEDLIIST
jgi:hypothetical protein